MEYYSCVESSESAYRYARSDFCAACWEHPSASKLTHFWTSKIPNKKIDAASGQKERLQQALLVLKENLQKEDAESAMAAFVLSLYLLRKRLLVFKKEIQSSELGHTGLCPLMLCEVSETEEMLCIPKVKVSEAPIAQLKALLADLFMTSSQG
jgi:Zn-dependent M16 (insulinase) family peptidase